MLQLRDGSKFFSVTIQKIQIQSCKESCIYGETVQIFYSIQVYLLKSHTNFKIPNFKKTIALSSFP